MRARFRPPMFAIAAALLGLIAVLATLQYRWLGRISDAERERMRTTLAARAAAFAQDFDRELTLAYMLFQFQPIVPPGAPALPEGFNTRLADRHERWGTTARYPGLIREFYVASRGTDGPPRLQRFNPGTRGLDSVEWPPALSPVRAKIVAPHEETPGSDRFVLKVTATGLWEDVPALVVPGAPPSLLFMQQEGEGPAFAVEPVVSYTILLLDREYMATRMLPALAAQHFAEGAAGFEYQLAVVEADGGGLVYGSTPSFAPAPDVPTDAAADLFRIRPQEFPHMVADVRRFTADVLHAPSARQAARPRDGAPDPSRALEMERRRRLIIREADPTIVVEAAAPGRERALVASASGSPARTAATGRWRLLAKHPSGSLEAAVDSVRRRNILISSSILAVLGASIALLVLSTRRSQETARQQMEFVAAVSHELRTPLAVIRAAGDNLADGVVQDPEGVRKYGTLVRGEGRRLTQMVEQILEFAGIHSGQRALQLSPVDVHGLLSGVLRGSETLITAAGLRVEVQIPADLPPVAGDEAALSRVFQNLVGNAIKYGASGGWIGIAARRSGGEAQVTVSDRGIGIAPADQPRIFDPFYRAADVVAAQIQGAGLGLSLVYRIVEAHGGRITVRSTKGAGSSFTVHLRIAGEHRTAESAARLEGVFRPVDPPNAAPPAVS